MLKKQSTKNALKFSNKVRGNLKKYNLKNKHNIFRRKKIKLTLKLKRSLKKSLSNLKKYSKYFFLKKKRKRVLKLSLARKKIVLRRKRRRRYLKKRFNLRKKRVDSSLVINFLKYKVKFQYIYKKGLKFCKLFFKYTGSNFFATITNNNGDVFFSYSLGVFKGYRTRKEKTTIFAVQQLGQLVSLRLYKSVAKNCIFVPLINHRRLRTFLRYFFKGIKSMKFFYFFKTTPKRKVIRNGVRLRKIPRR